MKRYILPLAAFLLLAFTGNRHEEPTAPSKRYKPIVLNPEYEHTKWGIGPEDIMYHFAAYTTSFDSNDDNNGDGSPDLWGIPEWVAYEIKRETGRERSKYKRPSPWMTDPRLNKLGIAPDDGTYAVSGTRKLKAVSTDSRYVRGHMCPKNSADRLSDDAGYNTHTVLNAVPQLQWQNNGIWKYLEEKSNSWADTYGRIWVVSGPVFFGKNPAVWLGQKDNVKAAVPDAIYKILVREDADSETGITSLAFIFPNVIPKAKKDISEYLTTINQVEELTGLEFLTALSKSDQRREKKRHEGASAAEASNAVKAWQL